MRGRRSPRFRSHLCAGVCLILSCRSESPRPNDEAPSAQPNDEPRVLAGAGHDAEDPSEVSLIQLITTPERFRGKWVRVIGYVVLEFEGNAIYLHEEDFTHGLVRNALWLRVESKGTPTLRRPGYAIVEGRFAPDVHGHMDLFSGGLTDIQRMTLWPGRDAAP